ncbi:MAG: ABC transporter ATP-binding protein [Deltaproteobacteria bacterium]|nr:ABC transporter ATP-binding protein [Deltaproteobacteria bacterium]
MNKDCISLQGINKFYGSGQARQQVLFDVSLDIPCGELLSIVGTSGSGKSTLLNIIGGLDRNYEGTVLIQNANYANMDDAQLARLRNENIGFIFQAFNLLDHLTCWENVCLPALFDRRHQSALREHATEVLDRVGLSGKTDARPSNLSGGQKQRIAIARALFNHPTIMLCDEPTGNLDSDTGRQIIQLFRDLNEHDGITLILVTHENRLSQVAHRIVQIEDGRIASEQINTHPIRLESSGHIDGTDEVDQEHADPEKNAPNAAAPITGDRSGHQEAEPGSKT